MSYEIWPGVALRELLEQHAAIRHLVAECERLAELLEDGAHVAGALGLAVAELRQAFDAHNRHEERLLRPVLIAADSFGPVRIDQLVDDHIHEHRAVRATLDDLSVDTLCATLATLRRHLEEEERYFLTSRVLRDDLITVEGDG